MRKCPFTSNKLHINKKTAQKSQNDFPDSLVYLKNKKEDDSHYYKQHAKHEQYFDEVFHRLQLL